MCAPIKSFPSTPTAAAKIITFVTPSPPTVLCLHFNSPVHSTLFFNQISIVSCFFFFFSKKGTQCITVSKRLLLGPPVLRGTRSISSCSSWWWQGVAPLGGSLVGGVWWAGEWRAVACPREGRPPSMCVPPGLPADGSHALHYKGKDRNRQCGKRSMI